MNYEKIYNQLIFNAKKRSCLKSTYTEIHHVLPKSLFPEYSKTKWNLVELLPEEHILAHLLLVKIYPNNKEMIYAVNMMSSGCGNGKMKRKVTNKQYRWVRERFAKLMKENNPMVKDRTEDEKKELHKPLSEYWENITEEQREDHRKKSTNWKNGKNPFLGRTHTDEVKKIISEKNSGRVHTEDTKQKIRESNLNTPRTQEWNDNIRKSKMGENNPTAKNWMFISPDGTVHKFKGGLARFLRENGLPTKIDKWMDIGVIPKPDKPSAYDAVNNLVGWQIISQN